MTSSAAYYERIGDTLSGSNAARAYRAAQNQLALHDPFYLVNFRRIQQKLCAAPTKRSST
jgi:hypothetical protein